MTFKPFFLFIGIGIFLLAACQTQKPVATTSVPVAPVTPPKFSLKNENDSISYSIGVSIGQSLKAQGLDSLSVETLAKAIKSVYNSDTLLISNEQANQFLSHYFQNLQIKKAEAAKKVGQQFLEEN